MPQWSVIAGAAGLALLWLLAADHLRPFWRFDPQYAHGWFVLPLAAWLFYMRWPERPMPQPEPLRWRAWLILLPLLTPLWLIERVNPDWRLLSWLLTLSACALTLLLLHAAGGRPWMRHFAFPVFFTLTAVPWPTVIEQPLTQGMMRLVAVITVEMANWSGVPALSRGNIIVIGNGVLGIDEACSGIRSLQASIMAALFLGGFYRMRPARFSLLLILAVGAAFSFNIIRSYLLLRIAASNGVESVLRWHDSAGFTIFTATFAVLFAAAFWLNRNNKPEKPPAAAAAAPLPFASPAVSLSLLGGVLCAIALTEFYYLARTGSSEPQANLKVQWPVNANGFATLPVTQPMQSLLRASDGSGATWTTPGGARWAAYFFQWDDAGGAALLAAKHSPEVCLPAAGNQLGKELAPLRLKTGDAELMLRGWPVGPGRGAYVWHLLWASGNAVLAEADWSAANRLRAVAEGDQAGDAASLVIAVEGNLSPDQAVDALKEQLRELLQIGGERG